MKTGNRPMQTRLRLFLDWGIRFEEPYILPERIDRAVRYASRAELEQGILRCYPPAQSPDADVPEEESSLPGHSRLPSSAHDGPARRGAIKA